MLGDSKTTVNWARAEKLVRSTFIIPQRLIDDGYPYQFDLRTSLLDWIQTDDSLAVKPRLGGQIRPEPATFFELQTADEARSSATG